MLIDGQSGGGGGGGGGDNDPIKMMLAMIALQEATNGFDDLEATLVASAKEGINAFKAEDTEKGMALLGGSFSAAIVLCIALRGIKVLSNMAKDDPNMFIKAMLLNVSQASQLLKVSEEDKAMVVAKGGKL